MKQLDRPLSTRTTIILAMSAPLVDWSQYYAAGHFLFNWKYWLINHRSLKSTAVHACRTSVALCNVNTTRKLLVSLCGVLLVPTHAIAWALGFRRIGESIKMRLRRKMRLRAINVPLSEEAEASIKKADEIRKQRAESGNVT